MAVALPNIRCPTYLREKIKKGKGKNVGALDLVACEAAQSLQARHGFWGLGWDIESTMLLSTSKVLFSS